MEKIFDQEYLDRVSSAGADVHVCLKLLKELVHKLSLLERKIDEPKQQ